MLTRSKRQWTLADSRKSRKEFYEFLNMMGLNRQARKQAGFYPSKWFERMLRNGKEEATKEAEYS